MDNILYSIEDLRKNPERVLEESESNFVQVEFSGKFYEIVRCIVKDESCKPEIL